MGLNVLIVDDSSTMRSMIRKTISMSGISVSKVFEASNGQEGLDILEREWIDIVLVDINMPVMNGLEMIDRIKGKPELAEIAIVVISTESSQTRIHEVRQKGVIFIHKPFTPEHFREAISKLLGSFKGRINLTPELLEKVGKDVLETMTFAILLPETTSADLTDSKLTSAKVNFSGPFNGSFTLTITHSAIPEMALNMLGGDDIESLSEEQINDAIGEIANVMCGNLLAEMVGPDPVFNLKPPEIIKEHSMDSNEYSISHKISKRLFVSNGWAELKLDLSNEKSSVDNKAAINTIS